MVNWKDSPKWSHSKLVTIWKGAAKGKIEDPSTYRGIQIGSTFCKILVVITLERIRKWYDKQLLDQQQGFRSGRGTADGIYIVKRIQQISYRSKKTCIRTIRRPECCVRSCQSRLAVPVHESKTIQPRKPKVIQTAWIGLFLYYYGFERTWLRNIWYHGRSTTRWARIPDAL